MRVTFTVLVYRILISVGDDDALFMKAEELRSAREHIRRVNGFLKAFGYASLALLAAIVAVWAAGRF